MDVLKPAIIRIGERSYRKNPIEKKTVEQYEEEEMDSSLLSANEAYDEICDAFDHNIHETDKGFQLDLSIPTKFFKYIIGKKGETKRRLEDETQTQIQIPRPGIDGDVLILGRTRKGILSAKTRVDILVDTARQRHPFTHFLSIPINAPVIREKFAEFKDDICRFSGGDRGVDETIFQNPLKLHLTLGTMVLLNDFEINKAVQLLQECSTKLVEPILKGCHLVGQFRGLEYMNDDPGAVDVLYAKVELQDESDRLQVLVDRMVDTFTESGLMQREYDRVKLHATVMNTLMRKDPSGTSIAYSQRNRGGKERESFNAYNILKRYGDFDFGSQGIDTIQISQRYGTGCDGYYSCEAKLNLP